MPQANPHHVAGKDLLTARDVAARLSMSTRTLYRLVAAGSFPRPVRLGRRFARWRASDVQRFLDGLGAAS
jgi:prophage regulatory protein